MAMTHCLTRCKDTGSQLLSLRTGLDEAPIELSRSLPNLS